MTEEPNKLMMKALDPIFELGLEVTEITTTKGEERRYVLKHPNGQTVGDILSKKIREPADQKAAPGQVQGMEVGGQFNYERCHFAELRMSEPKEERQEVVVLHVESPTEIYVCPLDQIALAETLREQIRNYVGAVEASFRYFRPSYKRMCIAQASDEQWYRATCLAQ